MSHYDLTIFLLLSLAVGIPCALIGYALSVLSWGKADQMVQDATNELPQWNNPLYWDEMLLTKNCPDCQQDQAEQEQKL